MDDLVKRLTGPAYWMSGSGEGHEGENDTPFEAAARIEALEAMLRECVVSMQHATNNMAHPDQLIDDTLTRAKEMLK